MKQLESKDDKTLGIEQIAQILQHDGSKVSKQDMVSTMMDVMMLGKDLRVRINQESFQSIKDQQVPTHPFKAIFGDIKVKF